VPCWKDVPTPKRFPEEFQRGVVVVVRRGAASRVEVAADFTISESTLKLSLAQADTDVGINDGLPTAERKELVQLRRRTRRLEMENEILRHAAAYFAAETLPK
jgi:transposase-like protein